MNIIEKWLQLKEMEIEVKQKRYEVENRIAKDMGYDPLSGKGASRNTETHEVKFSPSKVRKVDYDIMRKIQRDNAIPETEINRIFRFNVLLNMSEYNTLSENQKSVLDECITVQINKPTLKIIQLEKDK